MQLHAHEGPWVAKKLEGTLFTERAACGQYAQLKVLADKRRSRREVWAEPKSSGALGY